jgi:hypothetical protein
MQGSGLEDEEDIEAVNALIAAITSRSLGRPRSARAKAEAAIRAAAAGDFGLSAEDFRGIAADLPFDSTVIIGLFENTWERKFKTVAAKYGGTVINQRFVTAEALAQATGRHASS